MGLFRSALKLLALGSTGLLAVLLVRTATFPSLQPNVGRCSPEDADFIKLTDEMIGHFQEAIKLKTIARSIDQIALSEILEFHKLIEKSFPLIHSSELVKRETVNTHSLLYTVQGSDPSLKPYMLMGHMDVVPVDQQTWEVPPFEGRIVDGYLYGRGTIDNKNSVMGIMEALEFRLKNGLLPVRSFYIAFGHDEEVAGTQGAKNIAKLLRERKVQLEFILDEGTTVLKDTLRGVEPAIAVLEQNPFPSMFGTGPEKGLIEAVASEAVLPLRFVLTNLWFFGPLVSWVMSLKPATNAMVRTTTALTMVGGGTKINVLAPSAWAMVNHRIHPSQTIQEVIDYDRKIIGDDRIKLTPFRAWDIDPAPISPYGDDVFGYQTIARSIKQVFPDSIVAPGIMIANTDSKYYQSLSGQIYRFCPTFMYPTDLPRYHGVNERMSLENIERTINFFYHMTSNADTKHLENRHSHNEEL